MISKPWDTKKGLTLTDVILAMAIVGILAMSLTILVRILNSLKFQNQLGELNTQVQLVLRQMTHEIRNAPALEMSLLKPNDLSIRVLDFERYGPVDPNVFIKEIGGVDNWGTIKYQLITENSEVIHGRLPTLPYLLKTTDWSLPDTEKRDKKEVFFEGVIRAPPPGVLTFNDQGSSSQLVKISLRFVPSYLRKDAEPLLFSSMATVRSSGRQRGL